MIVTIDGPAGAGKSSAARGLAQRLGYQYLDTGAMYRALTLAVLRAGVDPSDEQALQNLLNSIQIDMPPGQVVLNGEDVSSSIRTNEVSNLASSLATIPIVREHLARLQREIGEGRNIICEGRDQGTVVFPDAEHKFFLLADPIERARRRQKEMEEKGQTVSLEQLAQEIRERDERDAGRAHSPMVPAKDATQLDSTKLTLTQVIDRMEEIVKGNRNEGSQD